MDRAQSLYIRASALGDEGGLNYLGAFQFISGTGNQDQGIANFRKAAESGTCARALNNLAICFENGYAGCQQNYEKAMQLYDKSAKLSFCPAMVNRAYLHYKIAK